MVRSRLFCKEKTVIPRNATAGDKCHSGRFRITQTAISPYIGISGSRGHAAIAIAQRSSSNGSHHKVNRFWNRYVRASCDRKHQTPSTKHQRNSKLQPPKTWEVIGWSLKIGASLGLEVGIWSLTQHIYIS